MAKRLTDTNKWTPSFRKLSLEAKCFWFYLQDNCDHAGIWLVDFEHAEFSLGSKVDKAVQELSSFYTDLGEYWIIKDFVSSQYGELNPSNNVHKSVINRLESIKGLTRVCEEPAKPFKKIKHLSITEEEHLKLVRDYGEKNVLDIYDAIENYKKNNNYVSLYLTARKWLTKSHGEPRKNNNELNKLLELGRRGH